MTSPHNSRTLLASINNRLVGTLRDENGYWAFQYAPEWLADSERYPLSPALPLREDKFVDDSSTRAVAWYFDNLLPEENARVLLASDAGVTVQDAWGLLAYFGAESAGAITLLPPEVSPEDGGLRPLTNAALQVRIDQLPRHSLSADSPKRMSLAGAQHKLAVVVHEGELFEPVGSECSTHILKPDSKTEGYPHTAINEHFCMQLAAEMSLPVPRTEIRYVPSPVYLVERFDRRASGEGLARIHALDALQLLSYDRTLKYHLASAGTLKDCIEHCPAALLAKRALFSWTVFNVLVGNGDAHMKNVSFLVDATGIRLAPFYDIVSTVVYASPEHDRHGPYWPNIPLSMPIGQARSFSDITRADVLQFASDIDLPKNAAVRLLDDQLHAIEAAADRLVFILGQGAGEKRLLKSIRYMPIREMVVRLRS